MEEGRICIDMHSLQKIVPVMAYLAVFLRGKLW